MVPPNHPIVHRVWNSIIFTIHFGGFSPYFLETSIYIYNDDMTDNMISGLEAGGYPICFNYNFNHATHWIKLLYFEWSPPWHVGWWLSGEGYYLLLIHEPGAKLSLEPSKTKPISTNAVSWWKECLVLECTGHSCSISFWCFKTTTLTLCSSCQQHKLAFQNKQTRHPFSGFLHDFVVSCLLLNITPATSVWRSRPQTCQLTTWAFSDNQHAKTCQYTIWQKCLNK